MSLGPSGSDLLDHGEPQWQPIQDGADIPPGRYILHNEVMPWTLEADRRDGEWINDHGHKMCGMTHYKRKECA